GKNCSALPNIGIADSGGGYHALMIAAGAAADLDSRTPGPLQFATYFAGFFGRGWLISSLCANNFTSVQSILDS
ncbi:uncharacterized protein K452DRAFT_200096, partial [Aplosporella prunicola CBS 121167]